MADSEDDGIPILDEIVRPGNGSAPGSSPGRSSADNPAPTLSQAEIEAIANRVIERYSQEIELAIARAIREALQAKTPVQQTTDPDAEG